MLKVARLMSKGLTAQSSAIDTHIDSLKGERCTWRSVAVISIALLHALSGLLILGSLHILLTLVYRENEFGFSESIIVKL